MKKLISTLLLATTVSQFAMAQNNTSVQFEVSDEPRSEQKVEVKVAVDQKRSSLIESLRQLELPEQYATPQQRTDKMKAVLDQLRIQDLLGQEGVDRVSLPDPAPMQFNTAQIIKNALEDAKPLGMGEKIQHYDQQVDTVLKASYSLDAERTARMTLNRAFDVVNTTLVYTNTPAAQALGLAGLYERSFQLALSQIASNVSIYKSAEIAGVTKMRLFMGDYGVRFAKMMKPAINGANLTPTHRAILLLKTLGYLAWDLRLDVRAMSPNSQAMMNLMTKIYNLQKNTQQTNGLLYALEHSMEPNQADIRFIADKVLTIIDSAEGTLETAKTELGIR